MRREIWRRSILSGFILCFGGLPVWGEDGRPAEASVTIAVHNHAGVTANTLDRAERTASLVFKQAGVEVNWVNCRPAAEAMQIAAACRTTEFPRHLQLVIAGRSKNLNDSVLGVSYLGEDGTGCYSDVFFAPAEELHDRLHLDLGTLLGNVVAHEIAHLLLGTNAHSDTGIMRPHWNGRDLASASRGELLFTRAQGQTMRETVTASLCRKESATVTARSD